MKKYQTCIIVLPLFAAMLDLRALAEKPAGYSVVSAGGSLTGVKTGSGLHLSIASGSITIFEDKTHTTLVIPATAVTAIETSTEVHHRIGTGIAVSVVTLGAGIPLMFSKSKKHYIGLEYNDSGTRGGFTIQADKNEYRGILTALEGATGKTAVDLDSNLQK